MTSSTVYWIMAAINFVASMILSLLTSLVGGDILAVLMLSTLSAGWILWVIGLISRLRGN